MSAEPVAIIKRVDRPPTNGNCKGHDPSKWFPQFDQEIADAGGNASREMKMRYFAQVAEAKGICSDCHGKEQCFAYGIYHEQYGIWGGSTERERNTFRRKHKIDRVIRESITEIQGMNLHADKMHLKRMKQERERIIAKKEAEQN